jgi:hypothetical protein
MDSPVISSRYFGGYPRSNTFHPGMYPARKEHLTPVVTVQLHSVRRDSPVQGMVLLLRVPANPVTTTF